MFHTTFYLRRLHSLVGLLAIGIFLFEHIITNARALGGAESLNGALAMMELIPHPIFLGLEIFGVALPILFHAIYGIYIALQAKNNPGRYGYVRNWQFALQRWTAWFLVIFLIWHVFYLRIFTKAINGTPDALHEQPDYDAALHDRHDRRYLPFLQWYHDFLHDLGYRQGPAHPERHQRSLDVPLCIPLPCHDCVHGKLLCHVRPDTLCKKRRI